MAQQPWLVTEFAREIVKEARKTVQVGPTAYLFAADSNHFVSRLVYVRTTGGCAWAVTSRKNRDGRATKCTQATKWPPPVTYPSLETAVRAWVAPVIKYEADRRQQYPNLTTVRGDASVVHMPSKSVIRYYTPGGDLLERERDVCALVLEHQGPCGVVA